MENLLVALLSFTLLASTSAVRIIGGSTPTIARGSGARMGVLENPAAPVLSGENLQDCLSRALDASPRKHIALLGSTGSIGTQTLDICREYPEAFEVISISAGANVELLAQQAIEFKPTARRARPWKGSQIVRAWATSTTFRTDSCNFPARRR